MITSACGDEGTSPVTEDPFTVVWTDGFEAGASGWLTADIPGPEGWCGDVSVADAASGPVPPSSGGAYGLVEHGACNAFWAENGFADGSGPASVFDDFSESWPEGGFRTELDVYLDPDRAAGSDGEIFTYAMSVVLLDQGFPAGLRYFFFPVTGERSQLRVMGSPVDEPGWYTLRQTFRDRAGDLEVEFEPVRDDDVLATVPVTATALSGEPTSSFASANVGTGYAWFVSIRNDLRLPVDRQALLLAE